MRKQYQRFVDLETEILDVGPDSADEFRSYWAANSLPFPGLADPKARVSKVYKQGWKMLKLGRMPLQLIVDKEGVIRQRHDASSMSDIPPIDSVLSALERL